MSIIIKNVSGYKYIELIIDLPFVLLHIRYSNKIVHFSVGIFFLYKIPIIFNLIGLFITIESAYYSNKQLHLVLATCKNYMLVMGEDQTVLSIFKIIEYLEMCNTSNVSVFSAI